MEKLNILWMTSDKATVTNMMAMYTVNAIKNGWFDEIDIVIWGGSAKLVAEDSDVQELVKKMIESGINIEACKACADKYNAAEIIKELGVDVKYMGKPLTTYIKSDDYMITI